MRKRFQLAAQILMLLFSSGWMLSQSAPQAKGADQDTGVRPYVPFGGANENINLTNGNVSLAIPLVHLKGRNGHDLSLSLYYNSKSWRFNGSYNPDTNSMGGTWTQDIAASVEPQWLHSYGNGWRLGIPSLSGTTNVDWVNSRCEGEAVVTMSDGSKYAFNNRYGCGSLGAPGTPIAIMDSEDGTGMQLDMTNSADSVLTMRNGTRMHFAGTYGLPTKIVDANGNKITFSEASGILTITDTLGRTVTVNESTPSVTYKDSAGTDRTIGFTTGNVSVNIFFYNPYPSTVSNPRIIAGNRSNSYTTVNLTGVSIPVDDSHNQSFTFSYNAFNELSKIVYPTGGYTAYTYAPYTQHLLTTDPSISGDLYADFREITQRAVCRNASGSCPSGEDITTYSPTMDGTANNQYMDVGDPLGNKTRHQFTMGVVPGDGTADDHGLSPREINVWYYLGTSTLLRTVHTDYDNSSSSIPVTYEWSLPTKITTTLNDVSPTLVKEEDLSYPTFSVKFLPYPTVVNPAPSPSPIYRSIDNVKTHLEYDWGSGAVGNLLRRTENEWVTTNPVNSLDYFSGPIRLLSLKAKTSIFPAATGTTPLASTRYTYDSYVSPYTLASTAATHHEDPLQPLARGNLTKVERASGSAWLATSNQFDDTGNIIRTKDPGMHETAFTYGEATWNETTCYSNLTADSFAYVTKVTNALNHTNSSRYNSCTGTVASVTDANSRTTSQTFDGIGRPLITSLADGGQVTNLYTDSSNKVTTTTKHSASADIITVTFYDGLGRPVLEELCEDATTSCTSPIKTDTTYDSMGRKSTVSNPYRTTADATYGFTEYRYDALGRVVRVLPPDAPRDSDINNIKTDYSGNKTTVTDQAGKQRVSYVDALGRLTRVEEPGVTP
ncbi:MAG: repeat protein [Acidobacteriales bacterium]|nr:repeat protein [Terriglobales bacterium]